MGEKKYKQIGWIVEYIPPKGKKWRVLNEASHNTKRDAWRKYYRSFPEGRNPHVRCVPVYVEVPNA